MKFIKILLFIVSVSGLLAFQSCSSNPNTTTTQGNWVKVQPFKGVPRSGLVTFTIGNKVYAGLGYNGKEYLSDFYVLNGLIWKSIASFPANPTINNPTPNLRERAVAFSVGSNGYVGLGYNRNNNGVEQQLNDFWKYDPGADKWTQVSSFPGGRRYNAVAVGIGENGYVGTGYDGTSWFGDFWQYTPGTDTWKEIVSYAGDKREGASAFILNGKMLLAGGRNNGLFISDLWEFDAGVGSWTKRAQASNSDNYTDFKNTVRRSNAVAFAFNDHAYMAIGSSPSLTLSVYEYDPTTYRWTLKTNFEGSSRQNAIWFVADGKAYVGLGEAGSSRYDDIWEWRPLEDYNADD